MKRPQAPAVYRPQPVPLVLQRRVNPHTVQSINKTASPATPLVHRPQQVSKLVQPKSSPTPALHAGRTPRQPVVNSSHRPETKKTVQPKVISPQRRPATPPVCSPPQSKIAQPKTTPSMQRHTLPKTSPVHPHSKPVIAQPRLPGQMKMHPMARVTQPNAARITPAGQTIQRTTWRFRNGIWDAESASSSDTDPHPAPADYCKAKQITAKENDKYDQETGVYTQWARIRDRTKRRAKLKKRPGNYGKFFTKDREITAYGFFKPRDPGEARNAGLQGPHLLAHVTKRTIFDMAEDMGLEPEKILGSKVAPKPRQALAMMIDMLAARKLTPKPGALSAWYRHYKQSYGIAEAQKKGWKQGLKQVLEAHPHAVYGVGRVAKSGELAGKQEDAEAAVADIDKLVAHDRASGLPPGLVTVDRGYEADGWKEGEELCRDFIYNYGGIAIGRPPSPSAYKEAPKSPERDDDW